MAKQKIHDSPFFIATNHPISATALNPKEQVVENATQSNPPPESVLESNYAQSLPEFFTPSWYGSFDDTAESGANSPAQAASPSLRSVTSGHASSLGNLQSSFDDSESNGFQDFGSDFALDSVNTEDLIYQVMY